MLGHVVDVSPICSITLLRVSQSRFAIMPLHHFEIHIETLILEPIDTVEKMVHTQIVEYHDAGMSLRDVPDGPVKTRIVSDVVKRHILTVQFSPRQPV